jgi:predicted enzyme related to lactoylglutathione lyase
MELEHNVVGWFEIPVIDMERAINFYESLFDVKLERHPLGPLDMAWFPWIEGKIGSGGSLVFNKENYKPSPDGVLIYFTTTSGNINEDLKKIEKNGGKVIQPKTMISEDIGYMALFIDSEGNRIALHSRN